MGYLDHCQSKPPILGPLEVRAFPLTSRPQPSEVLSQPSENRLMVHAPPRPAPGLPPIRINLYSDTQTKPTQAMRAAMMEAEVGDEQGGLDPSVNALCDRMAALLGKDAAIFLPSGTMCNEIAILTHCRPGDAVLAHETAHILTAEGGAPGALAGVQITPLHGADGQFDAQTLTQAILPRSRYAMPQTLLSVEQTANLGGGTVWPVATLAALAETAHAEGMATHMDGARLMNAVVAASVSAAEMAAPFDSVWLDFTKGLGAPLGAVLCGSAAFIDAAWRWKQRLGGALRQGGICAAGCLYALDHHVERLAEDHAMARHLAEGLGGIPGLTVQTPQTNLVFIDCAGTGATAESWARRLRAEGVLISVMGRTRLRACTHLDVRPADIAETIAIMGSLRPS
jgi:threonine aldolase